MKRNLIFITFFMMIAAMCLSGAAVKISDGTYSHNCMEPTVQPYGTNSVMVAWAEHKFHKTAPAWIKFRTFNGSSWSAVQQVGGEFYYTGTPRLVPSPDGTKIHMIFMAGGGPAFEIFYSKYDIATNVWTTPVVISEGNNLFIRSIWPTLGIKDDGRLMAVWTQSNAQYLLAYNETDSSGNWKGMQMLSGITSSQISLHSNLYCRGKNTYLVWQEGTDAPRKLGFKQKIGDSAWGGTYYIDDYAGMWPGIVADSSYDLYVISDNGFYGDRYFERKSGTWYDKGKLPQVANANLARDFRSIDIDRGGNLHQVSTEDPADPQGVKGIQYNYKPYDSDSWNPTVEVASWSKGCAKPQVRADLAGRPHYVWLARFSESDPEFGYVYYDVGETQMQNLNITSPVASTVWEPGKTGTITWEGLGITGEIMIDLYDDAGTEESDKVMEIVANTGNDGTHEWTLPSDIADGKYRVKIYTNPASVESYSEQFVISAPRSVTVTYPNGGENIVTGREQTVTWESAGYIENVRISISVDNGSNWTTLVESAPAEAGYYTAVVPPVSSSSCLLKISDTITDTPSDVSDGTFALHDPEELATVDFNSDFVTDILWRNTVTGANSVWFMNGLERTGSAVIQEITDLTWIIAGTGDFNKDGMSDILWRNTVSGRNLVWFMNGTEKNGGAELPVIEDTAWEIVGTGDFNSDNKVDILWRNREIGANYVWYMDGVTRTGGAYLPGIKDADWIIAGTGDFNSDGKVDVLWRHLTKGANYVWYMDGVTRTGGAYLPGITNFDWEIVATGDFNKDFKVDVLWRNKITGANYVWIMDGVTRTSGTYLDAVTDPALTIVN